MIKNDESGKLVFLTLIAGRGQRDPLICALAEAGARLTSTMYGKGTIKAGYLQNLLGLVPEENKVVICCVLAHDNAHAVLRMLQEKFHFDKPNTGIAFTIPVDRLSF